MSNENIYTIDNPEMSLWWSSSPGGKRNAAGGLDKYPIDVLSYPRIGAGSPDSSRGPSETISRPTSVGYFCASKGKPPPLTTHPFLPPLKYLRGEEEEDRGGLRGEKGEELMAKGFRDCPYCQYVGASDVQLQHHISRFHEALIASEGEKVRAKSTHEHFNWKGCDVVEGYLHKCADGQQGKVALVEIPGEEGITREWHCVHCEKLLKTWLTEWTPQGKENYRRMQWGKYPTSLSQALLKEAIAGIGKKL